MSDRSVNKAATRASKDSPDEPTLGWLLAPIKGVFELMTETINVLSVDPKMGQVLADDLKPRTDKALTEFTERLRPYCEAGALRVVRQLRADDVATAAPTFPDLSKEFDALAEFAATRCVGDHRCPVPHWAIERIAAAYRPESRVVPPPTGRGAPQQENQE